MKDDIKKPDGTIHLKSTLRLQLSFPLPVAFIRSHKLVLFLLPRIHSEPKSVDFALIPPKICHSTIAHHAAVLLQQRVQRSIGCRGCFERCLQQVKCGGLQSSRRPHARLTLAQMADSISSGSRMSGTTRLIGSSLKKSRCRYFFWY